MEIRNQEEAATEEVKEESSEETSE